MKDSAEHSARLKRLCNRLRHSRDKVEPASDTDPTTEMVAACLSVVTTESRARTALNKLRRGFVDYNEVRVSRADEVAVVLGKRFPQAKAVAVQMLQLLNAVFASQDSLNLEFLQAGGKREARLFLESLEGMTPYVAAQVMLQGLGAHAFPVNEQMLAMLRGEDIITPDADAAEVQGFLERHLPASEIHETYTKLRTYADSYRGTKSRSKAKVAKKKTASKKTAKKSSKKKKAT